ncbi:iron-siderophore ABC transporter substrate-binding protein [Pseudoruegeria sp. HB172150]|uniref:iron-siderophore ABC transporter substrate-binding protein n=1 Tax=Pseudoruegeria sp. HB172150 TaxID=2721164 RepID=UPI0020A6D8D8|nr:iron-siderophore ABC transporter substrate-binding protein [Pseudoruegeria sp. HB172150]
MAPSRRGFLAGGAAFLAAPPVLAADSDLSFEHVYGTTTLTEPARRIVSLGYNTQDTVLAFDVVPVGIRYWYGDYDYGVWPWAQPYLGEAEPTLLTGEVSVEVVASLEPDLILGTGSGISEAEYALLSQIAPVVMREPQYSPYGSPWHADTRMVGKALGMPEKAEELVAGVEAKFSAARERHPDWQGQTAIAAWHDGGQTGAFMAEDTRARFLTELGFVPTEKLVAMDAIDGFYTTLSPEDLSALDADLLIWISSYDRAPDIAKLAMRRTLDAHFEGREVFAGQLIGGALSFGSVLSLPFALDALEQEIDLALDGDPATVVPSAEEAGLIP